MGEVVMAAEGAVEGRWPLGCQIRPWLQTWGVDGLRARLLEVMATVGGIGFDGFETTLLALPLDDPAAFADASARAGGVRLCGAHAAGRWWAEEGGATIGDLVGAAAKLPALGCDRLVVSMEPTPESANPAQIDRIVRHLDELGRGCREAGGVTVAFHNHGGELAEDARVLAAIAERCDPGNVALGADLGWVAHTGVDPADFVRRFGERIGYLHVRDVTALGPNGAFLEVGRGVFDYDDIVKAFEDVGYDGWLTAESEFSETWRGAAEPEETVRVQYAGLRGVVG